MSIILIKSFTGALLAYVCIFAPGFFIILGIIPYWNSYRQNKLVQEVLRGISCTAIGFIISAGMHLFADTILYGAFSVCFLVVFSILAIERFKVSVELIILTNAVLGYVLGNIGMLK